MRQVNQNIQHTCRYCIIFDAPSHFQNHLFAFPKFMLMIAVVRGCMLDADMIASSPVIHAAQESSYKSEALFSLDPEEARLPRITGNRAWFYNPFYSRLSVGCTVALN